MKADNLIKVLWDDCLVGTLAMTQDQRVAFQYSDEWLEREILGNILRRCNISICP